MIRVTPPNFFCRFFYICQNNCHLSQYITHFIIETMSELCLKQTIILPNRSDHVLALLLNGRSENIEVCLCPHKLIIFKIITKGVSPIFQAK